MPRNDNYGGLIKDSIIKIIDIEYLQNFLISMQNSPKYSILNKDDQELTKFIKNKLSESELNEIKKSFLFGKSSKETAEKFRESNGKELANKYINNMNIKLCRKEFSVDKRICDISFLNSNNEIVAIEIKANGDKLNNANAQCQDYMKWANYTYLLIEEKKIKELKKFKIGKNIGIIVFSNNKKFIVQQKARYLEHGIETYLSKMRKSGLVHCAKMYYVKSSGRKTELCERILNKLHGMQNLSNENKQLIGCKKTFLLN